MNKLLLPFFFLISVANTSLAQQIEKYGQYSVPVFPGNPGVRPFWNQFALRFVYAPAFDFPKLPGATAYRFTVTGNNGNKLGFIADKPWADLSPIWEQVAEGFTKVTVEGLDSTGIVVGHSGERLFYRSPTFSGILSKSDFAYQEAAKKGLKALFESSNVQNWLQTSEPDPQYRLYCYPNKVMGGLIRAMVAYSRVANSREDRESALKIAKRTAEYLLSVRSTQKASYANVPPTYLVNVQNPYPQAVQRSREHWLMVPSVVDAAFGFLDLYDATGEQKFLHAALKIAETLSVTQESDGTWPLMVNSQSGKSVHNQRLIPTWIIFFFDRLERQYRVTEYRSERNKAWKWIVENPLKTYQWNGQFEDVKLHGPYVNLAREQACDVALLLFENGKRDSGYLKQADELLRFAEDQFVVWSEVEDPAGWNKIMYKRLKTPELWLAPCVLEQFVCYEPVARSSAILINAYLEGYKVTGKSEYLYKAKALTNGLVIGQEWMLQNYGGTGEFPTWVMKRKPSNWLNNSYYAAQAVLNFAGYAQQ